MVYHSFSPEFQVVPLQDTTQVPFLDYLNLPAINIEKFCPSLDCRVGVKIEQSGNGLLLCSSMIYLGMEASDPMWALTKDVVSPSNSYGECDFFICNPTTKQFKGLVLPSCIEDFAMGASVYLVFDPLKSPHYKVISLHVLDSTNKYETDVYASETESWTQAIILCQWPSRVNICTGVLFNGAIHWYGRAATSACFDVDSKALKTIPMPPMLFKDLTTWKVLHFGESRDHLHLVVTHEDFNLSLEFDVLGIAFDYSGWFVRYHVDLHSTRTLVPELKVEMRRPFSVLCVICAEKEEESIAVLCVEGGVMSYNLYNGTSYKLGDLEWRSPIPHLHMYGLDYEGWDAFPHFEILVSV